MQHVPIGISRTRLAFKRWLKILLGAASLPLLGWRKRGGMRVLFYHRVNPYPFEQLGPVSRELTVTPTIFEAQLDWLRAKNYRSASPRELEDVLAGKRAADPKAILITFDDGFEDNFLWAHPLLLKYGFQGVFFIATHYVGAEAGPDWTVGDMPGYGRFMSWDQLRRMRREGAVIASHTCSHRLLTSLTAHEISHELTASRAALTAQLEDDAPWFAYPAGVENASVRAAVAAAGYRVAFTTVPGATNGRVAAMAVPRSEVSASDSLLTFRMKLAGLLDWTRFKECPAFRRLIGPINQFLIRRMVRV